MKILKILNKQVLIQGKQKKPKVKTIPGISKYSYWEWPIEGALAGFIQARSLQARSLPHIGPWTQFSPAVIADLCDSFIVQLQPTVSTHTQVFSNWIMPMPQLNGTDFLLFSILFLQKS